MTRCGGGGLANGLERIFRAESGRVLATLIRLLGDFDAAEEALQDAFSAALEQWPRQGQPDNPRAWLGSTGRNRAIDRIRRDARFAEKESMLSYDATARLADHDRDDESVV